MYFYTDSKGEPEGYEIKLNNISTEFVGKNKTHSKVIARWMDCQTDCKSKHRGIRSNWNSFRTCDVFKCYHIFESWYDTLDLRYDTLQQHQ